MTAIELIKELQKLPPNGEIVITGYYGSESNDFDIILVKEEDKKHFWTITLDNPNPIIQFASNICSG